jgi:hypothetical protein
MCSAMPWPTSLALLAAVDERTVPEWIGGVGRGWRRVAAVRVLVR